VKHVEAPEESKFLDDFPNGCGTKCQGKVTPDVLAALYNFDKSTTGLKTTMGVAEFQGVSYDDADLSFWSDACGQSATVDLQVGKNSPAECKVPLVGAELCLEALLDIDFIKGVGGDIPLTVVSTQQYSLANWAQALETMDNPPPIMSVSYGNDEIQQTSGAFMDSCNVQFQKLGAMGISVLFASGDQGVVGRTGKTRNGVYHPDFPAASPFITAVGGTDLATKSVIGAEKAWSDGGGGFSDHFAAPAYQTSFVESYLKKLDAAGLTPPAAAFNATGRAYPDIAAMAGVQNPYCVAASLAIKPSMTGVGGTSAACPVASGLFARLNAARSEKGMPNMGFLNPWIYQNPSVWNDVKEGSITGATKIQGFAALEGWDAATGFGTPNFAEMLKAALAAGEQVIV
jgi:tripeptidyl-peptidase-1